MRRPFALLVAAAVITLVGSACGSTLSDAATITYSLSGSSHDLHVTRDDLLNEVGKIVANKPFVTWLKQNKFEVNSNVTADTKISAIWLSQLIHQQAVDALFASHKLKVSATVRSQAAKDVVQIFPTPDIYPKFDAKYRGILIDRQARTEALLAFYTDTSDTAGLKYFKAHASQFACASGKNVAHILVATQAAAQQILDQLKTGASFATLAQQLSTDKQSGAAGGVLGCLAPGEFVPPFEAAAQAAAYDTPVGPVKSQFGYHVILVTHAVSSYDTSRSQVRIALAQQGQVSAQGAIDGLLKRFKVHLDPRFGTWGLVTNPQGQRVYEVSPPTTVPVRSSRETTTTSTATTLPVSIPSPSTGTP